MQVCAVQYCTSKRLPGIEISHLIDFTSCHSGFLPPIAIRGAPGGSSPHPARVRRIFYNGQRIEHAQAVTAASRSGFHVDVSHGGRKFRRKDAFDPDQPPFAVQGRIHLHDVPAQPLSEFPCICDRLRRAYRRRARQRLNQTGLFLVAAGASVRGWKTADISSYDIWLRSFSMHTSGRSSSIPTS